MRRALLFLSLAALLTAAAPPAAPNDLVREANEALRAGKAAVADELYAAAEERATDPGLVAFNRAAAMFEQKKYFEAEECYGRVLGDASCPPARGARAWYNRGTCLLHHAAASEKLPRDPKKRVAELKRLYSDAVACFENALDDPAADRDVKARAPHNLELAKQLWIQTRNDDPDAKKDESPNDNPSPDEEKGPRPESNKTDTGTDPNQTEEPGSASTQKTGQQPQAVQQTKADTPTPKSGEQSAPGASPTRRMLRDEDVVQNLSPEEVREYMKEAAKRRKRELHALLETLSGPDRAGARDR